MAFIVSVKPQFGSKTLLGDGNGVFTVIEGATRNITLDGYANPPQVQYEWSYPSTATDVCSDKYRHGNANNICRIKASNSILTITNAKRTDSGDYSVQAWNAHGDFSTTVKVHLNVLYPPM